MFITTKLERIIYSHISRLNADLNCINDLLDPNYDHPNLKGKNISTNWKYLLNSASTEFPLITNYEMTRILNIFNGANDIEVFKHFDQARISNSWIVKNNAYIVNSNKAKTSAPHNLTIAKGYAYGSFSRKFIEHVSRSQYAKDLLEWLHDTWSPDELLI